MHLLATAACAHSGALSIRRVSSKKIGKHEGRAHKLARDPRALQCFYSTGEDAGVRHYDLRMRNAGSKKLLVARSIVPGRVRLSCSLGFVCVHAVQLVFFSITM